MKMLLQAARIRLFTHHIHSSPSFHLTLPFRTTVTNSATKHPKLTLTETPKHTQTVLFIPPGTDPEQVTEDIILPNSNIVLGPYAGDAKVKEVQFIGSSVRPKDCPKDDRPEFAMLGRSNVGKSSLINSLVRKKEVALTSKKPGKTQLINHFLVNRSWYLVDLPGYGFANAPEAARMDWSSFTKGYFLNRESLVSVLLLVDASVPPQKIDLDCANWLGRNNIPMTIVFTKCDKMKNTKGKRPDENIKSFQELIKENYNIHPPWIMTSSATGLGRDDLLLHMSQLRNYPDTHLFKNQNPSLKSAGMENHHEAEDEENEEVSKLEEEVKSMAEKVQEFRQTFPPHHLTNTLANVFQSQRPPVSDFTRPALNHSDPNIEAITPLSLEDGVEALVRKDPMHAEEVQRIKRKISDNASAMSSLVKRIKDCTSRIEKLEASKQVMIYPAFARNGQPEKRNFT